METFESIGLVNQQLKPKARLWYIDETLTLWPKWHQMALLAPLNTHVIMYFKSIYLLYLGQHQGHF